MMSEDILAMRVEYKLGKKQMSQIMVVFYMTTAGPDADHDNRRKYEIVNEVMRENEHERILIVGDMNGHIGLLGEAVNENGQLLIDFTEDMRLQNLNVTIGDGRATWNAGGHKSAIDFMLVNERAREHVMNMWVDERREIDIESNHNVLVLNMNVSRPKVKSISKEKKCKWKIRNAKWDEFQVELTNMDWLNVHGVNEVNEAL